MCSSDLTGRLDEALLYLIGVALPAHLVDYYYRKSIPFPQLVMYVGVIVMGVFYLYAVGMRYLGVDYVQGYFTFLAEYRTVQLAMFDEMIAMISDPSVTPQLEAFKELIRLQVNIFETIYPALFLLFGILLAFIQVVLLRPFKNVLGIKGRMLSQFGNFTYSKVMGLLFIGSFLLAQFVPSGYEAFSILGVNVFFFISVLLEILGVIVVFVTIKRKKWGLGLKIIATLAVLFLLVIFPTAFMVVGLADTLFNFRKVKIVI